MSAERTRALLAAGAIVLLAPACSGEDNGPDEAADDTEPSPTCVGEPSGEVVISQGGVHQLPNGGEVGIGVVRMEEDPPTVNLLLGDDTRPSERDSGTGLSVGDAFTAQGTDYEITQICAGEVTATQVN